MSPSPHPAPHPDPVETALARAVAAHRAGNAREAAMGYIQAIAQAPGHAGAYNNLGVAFQDLDRVEDAVLAYRRAIALKPDHAAAFANLAAALRRLGRLDEAAAAGRRAVALNPDHAAGHNALGNILKGLGDLAGAEHHLRRAVALDPDFAEAHGNLGIALRAQGRGAEALEAFETALRLRPTSAEARLNRALALLRAGCWPEGWRAYEARWNARPDRGGRPVLPRPDWAGEALAGRRILLHAEQAYGDTIQFARFAPLLARQGARVLLRVPAPLVRLCHTLAGVETVLSAVDPWPDADQFDCHLPLMSVPARLGTRLDTLPADCPYLAADPDRTARWRARLGELSELSVGLVWSGDPRPHDPRAHLLDGERSLPLARFAPFSDLPGIRWISLQTGAPSAQAAHPPAGLTLTDWSGELTDFADTAALAASLDLIITVDTAMAHLAGALGLPVWVLSRFDGCWRWLEGRDDSPWYPTLRLFRQTAPGQWGPPLAAAAAALGRLAASAALGRLAASAALGPFAAPAALTRRATASPDVSFPLAITKDKSSCAH